MNKTCKIFRFLVIIIGLMSHQTSSMHIYRLIKTKKEDDKKSKQLIELHQQKKELKKMCHERNRDFQIGSELSMYTNDVIKQLQEKTAKIEKLTKKISFLQEGLPKYLVDMETPYEVKSIYPQPNQTTITNSTEDIRVNDNPQLKTTHTAFSLRSLNKSCSHPLQKEEVIKNEQTVMCQIKKLHTDLSSCSIASVQNYKVFSKQKYQWYKKDLDFINEKINHLKAKINFYKTTRSYIQEQQRINSQTNE